MYSYTVQAHKTSGETFVIGWDGDTAVNICGPLTPAEVEQATRDIESAGSFEYDPFQGDDSPASWQPPIATYDPS